MLNQFEGDYAGLSGGPVPNQRQQRNVPGLGGFITCVCITTRSKKMGNFCERTSNKNKAKLKIFNEIGTGAAAAAASATASCKATVNIEVDIDVDIDMVILENIDIDIYFLENIDIDKEILKNIDMDKVILQNIDIDKILFRFEFGISNSTTSLGFSFKTNYTSNYKMFLLSIH